MTCQFLLCRVHVSYFLPQNLKTATLKKQEKSISCRTLIYFSCLLKSLKLNRGSWALLLSLSNTSPGAHNRHVILSSFLTEDSRRYLLLLSEINYHVCLNTNLEAEDIIPRSLPPSLIPSPLSGLDFCLPPSDCSLTVRSEYFHGTSNSLMYCLHF